ncbi:MAG: zinc ribbon domain-containing protein [Planctomycetes bacterium]|nr:zinc ribbon domain-containing protein [Planctomycetota bacterium]
MPTYEYVCKDCGHRFEEMQRITADPLEVCPKCSGPVDRVIHGGAALVFKGSGFYATDSRKKNTSSCSECESESCSVSDD